MKYYFETDPPLAYWESETIVPIDNQDNIYQITADSLESACAVLSSLFPGKHEFIYLAAQLEDLDHNQSCQVLDWKQLGPEHCFPGQRLAISHFQGQTVQYIGKSCFCGDQEYWVLSIESDGQKQWIWLVTPYDPPQTYQEETYTKRQIYHIEQQIKKQLDWNMLPCQILLDGKPCKCTSILAHYTTEAAQDPWAKLFRDWLYTQKRLPASWDGQELAFLPLEIEPCVSFPIKECLFSFPPVRRSVLLEKPFKLDLEHPQTTVNFSIQGASYQLEIVDAQLINLKEFLTKHPSSELQKLLEQYPEQERQLLLGTRLIGEKELTLQVMMQEELDQPEEENCFALGLIGGFQQGIKSLHPGKVTLPVINPIALELFTAEWEETAPPPCKIF